MTSSLDRSMRILLLSEGDPEAWSAWSGISRSLVTHLRLAGHTVVAGNVDVRSTDRLIAAAATFAPERARWGTRYHLSGVPFRLRSRRARRIVAARTRQSDIIVQIGATFDSRGAAPLPYCLCCDSNILMAQHGVSTGFSDAARLTQAEVDAIRKREMLVYQGAAALFPLSARLGRSFVEDFDVPPERIHPIYAGPNLGPSLLKAAEARTADPARPPTILFVGLQFERKGGDVLVQSFRRIRAELPSARLLLAGVPADFMTEPGVTCLGVLDKNRPADAASLAHAYADADVFALPTRFEPFGIAFVEAMHFGLPCIGPNAWAVPEIIDDGRTGYLVPVDDVTVLTDRLLRLLRDRQLARAMGAAARDRAEQLFTWPRVIDRMTTVLTAVLEQSRSTHRWDDGRDSLLSQPHHA
jgi:glycosyltransferase involved in cell wall biosynthesis